MSTPTAAGVKRLADTMARACASVARARNGLSNIDMAAALETHRQTQVEFHAAIDALASLAAEHAGGAESVAPREWSARKSKDGLRVVIDSADFEHDAMLTLTGDFESEAQKLWFAGALADKLNAAPPTQPDTEAILALAQKWVGSERAQVKGNASDDECDAAREALRSALARKPA